jgi:hypothetical protein
MVTGRRRRIGSSLSSPPAAAFASMLNITLIGGGIGLRRIGWIGVITPITLPQPAGCDIFRIRMSTRTRADIG